MTLGASTDGALPLPALLAASQQLDDWSHTLLRLRRDGRKLAVLHSRDRRTEAGLLARRFSAPIASLGRAGSLRARLSGGDLLVVLTAGDRPALRTVEPGPSLHQSLQRGVVVWGITGPRPNPVSAYCHDVLAVPTRNPDLLLRCHRLAIRRLVGSPAGAAPPSSPRVEGRRLPSGF